jgi:hypothetical protein
MIELSCVASAERFSHYVQAIRSLFGLPRLHREVPVQTVMFKFVQFRDFGMCKVFEMKLLCMVAAVSVLAMVRLC